MWLACLILCLISSSSRADKFTEELLLKPLADGSLLASFNFVTTSPLSKSRQHFDLMPRLVGELLDEHHLEELDISLSRGVWRSQLWGFPPRTSAVGSKVSAIFNEKVQDLDKSWVKLTNALAGQFCASLNFLDSTQSITPKWSLSPMGISKISATKRSKFGMLPGENVCTENLTPWKKLLPCSSKRGLATFLNADHIHATKHHNLGLSLRKICPQSDEEECSDPLIELSLYVVLVFDPASLPDNLRASLTERESSWSNWSIRTLFGIGVTSACPLAEFSKIFIEKQDNFDILPGNQHTEELDNLRIFNVNKLVANGINNLSVKYQKPLVYGWISKPRIYANRYLKGHGNEKGGIVTKIFNEGTGPLKVVYLDVIPWFLRVYLHTLTVVTGKGEVVKPLKLGNLKSRNI